MTDAVKDGGTATRSPHPVLAAIVILASLTVLFTGYRHARLDRETLEAGEVLATQLSEARGIARELLGESTLSPEARRLVAVTVMDADVAGLAERVARETIDDTPYVHTLSRYAQLVELVHQVADECELRRLACEGALTGIGSPLRWLGRECADPCGG